MAEKLLPVHSRIGRYDENSHTYLPSIGGEDLALQILRVSLLLQLITSLAKEALL